MKNDQEKKRDPFYEISSVASATECTGLMPSLPQNEDEDESLSSLYATHDQPPDKSSKGKKKSPPK